MDGTLPDPAEVKKRLAADRLEGHRPRQEEARRSSSSARACRSRSAASRRATPSTSASRCSRSAASPTSWCRPAATCTSPARRAPSRGSSAFAIRAASATRCSRVAPIEDHSFSTSGDYERGFVKDGVRYHHILDPRTGLPAHASRSVTIRAKDAFTADAWSKVMFILGWKDGSKLIKKDKLDRLRGRVGRRQERDPHDAGDREGAARSSSSRRRAREPRSGGRRPRRMRAGSSQRAIAASIEAGVTAR